MIFMRILPGFLKELSKHVPTVLFKVVEWSELTAELPKLSRRVLQKEGYKELFDKQKEFLQPLNVELREESISPPEKISKHAAEKWLQIYFGQLLSPHGIFLDLRPTSYQIQDDKLIWNPTGLWTKFGPHFHEGLMEIYEGFYFQKEELYRGGLKKIGLISEDWSENDKNELADLFKAQFGDSIESEMTFDIEHFKSSIFKIANFLLIKKVTITKDFLYLGLYLVTLYAILEESQEKLAVKKIYLDTKSRLKT